MKSKLGLLHIYCGNGKGKTTAMMGLAMRAAGRGLNVCIVQFLKSWDTGEINSISLIPNIKLLRGKITPKFSFKMTDEEKTQTRQIHNEMLFTAISMCRNGDCDVLLLDEVLDAINLNLVDKDLFLSFIRDRRGAEVAVSGRDPSDELLALADYVSEVKKVKHPFDRGIQAREGIDK